MFVSIQARAGACVCKGPSIMLDSPSTVFVGAGSSISPGVASMAHICSQLALEFERGDLSEGQYAN